MNATGQRSFGDLLRHFRVEAGLTQEALAERARMSLAAIGKLERGESQRPYRATIALLADALSLSSSDRHELERTAQRAPRGHSESQQDAGTASNLPVHFSSFIGREGDLAKIGEMLANQRIVSLVGAGGVGKTRLALRAAERFIAANPASRRLDGVWFVDLSTVTDPEMTMTSIATSVGLQRCDSLDALVAYLRLQRFLLVLDNCEHIVDEVVQICGALLRLCPSAQILATSRQTLGLEGERIHRVPPLSVPPADVVLLRDRALEFSAIRLFADRAEAADSRFELTESTVAPVAEICRRLDGLALAIELAAARTNALAPATIAERLDKHLLDLDAVFNWSYELLDDREQRIFRSLSVFAGGFTLELATALWAGNLDDNVIIETLASLVDKSLMQCDLYAEPARYSMLEPARQYARDKLHQSSEHDDVARAHAIALLALAEDFDGRLELIPDRIWRAYIERERDNFRAALDWTFGPTGDARLGQRLAVSRAATWSGYSTGEIRKWVSAALETSGEDTPQSLLAKLAITTARTAVIFGQAWSPKYNRETVLETCRRALATQPLEDLRAVATAKFWIGAALQNAGSYDEAARNLCEARDMARSAGAQNEYNAATNVLAGARFAAGQLFEARDLITEVLRQSEEAGADRAAAEARAILAEIEFASGRAELALEINEKATQYFRTSALLLGVPKTLTNSAAYLVALKRYQKAREYAAEALLASRARNAVRSTFWALQHLVAAVVLSGSIDDSTIFQRAAHILGFIDEATKHGILRFYTEQQEYDSVLAALRATIGEEELIRLMTDGKAWTEDKAVAEALTL